MPTYYISALTGDNANNGTDPDFPKRTLGGVNGALISASSDRDFIEFLDEETYDESVHGGSLQYQAGQITIRHTASALGRPVIDFSGLGSTDAFDARGRSGLRFEGLEIKGSQNTSQQMLRFNTFDGAGLEIQDCFIYGFAELHTGNLNGASATPVKLIQSSFMFVDGANDAVKVNTDAYIEVENCFFSRSFGSTSVSILKTFRGTNATASFSTFIYNGNVNNGAKCLEAFGKVRNCVVSGAAGTNLVGIDALDHDYNLVNVGGTAFQNGTGGTDSPSANDIISRFDFIDDTSIGNTFSVVENYALAEGSRGIDEGTSFNSITVDIIGTTRPQGSAFDMGAFERLSPYWQDADNGETYSTKFGGSFEIHSTANKLATRTFPNLSSNRQAPYYVSIAGPATIRQRSGSYKAET